MKLRRIHLLLAALCGSLPAQDAGLTLAELAARSASIVTARCVAQAEARGQRSATLSRLEQLRGEPAGGPFVLAESAERRCGSALHDVMLGGTYLLFLDGQSPPRLLGGARGVEPLAPGLVDHVRALLAAEDDAARVRVLSGALRATAARVAQDAARGLKLAPRLELLADGEVRAQLAAALLLDASLAQPPSLDLLAAAARLREPAGLAVGASVFVAGARTELDRLVRFCLDSFDPEDVARHVAALAPAGARGRERQVELLAALPGPAAGQALRELARAGSGPARQAALTALVTRGEAVPADVAPPEIEAIRAQVEARQRTGPVFRNVRPAGTR